MISLVRLFSLLFLSIFTFSGSFAESRSTLKWAHHESDIPIDPQAITGELENGFRYLIYPHSEPPGRVSLRLHVDAGSLMEEEDQRGMAHFLEHLVFEGSENYSPKELIPEMQRLGIAFGAHANAYTSFDETVYMLDLPNLQDKTLKLAFTVMRDFADGALLLDAEVEAERGVILSEKNSRDSVDFRLMQKQFEYLFPEHLASRRMPIGTEECIKTTPRSRIKDFYEHYYVPSRMTLIVVGDIEPALFEKKIATHFSSLRPPPSLPEPPALGTISPPPRLRVAVFSDPEVDEEDLSLTRCIAHHSRPDTAQLRRENLSLSLANAIVTKRLVELAKSEDSPINGGIAYHNTWFDEITFGSLSVTPSEGRWQEAVFSLEQTFRQAQQYGFTQSEFEEASAEFLKAAKIRLDTASTRLSAGIAGELVQTINDRRVFSTPQTDYSLLQEALSSLSAEQAHAAFRLFWDHPDQSLILTTNQEESTTRATLLEQYQKSAEIPVEPPSEAAAILFAYQSFGEKGQITSAQYDEELQVHQLTFRNGVRANLKKTPFEKETISLTLSFGNGVVGQPAQPQGLSSLAEALFIPGGLLKHREKDLTRLMSGKRASITFQVVENHFALRGTTNAADLLFQLQLFAAYLTEPGYRAEALRQYRKSLPDLYDQLRHTLNGPLTEMNAWLRGNDARFVLPPLSEALQLEASAVKQWLQPHLETSALEINLVGDFDLEDAKTALAQTVGALPQRRSEPALPYQETLDLAPTGPLKPFYYQSQLERAASVVTWKTTGLDRNISEARRLSVASRVLSDRLREEIREKLGSTYSPSAQSEMSEAFPNFGLLRALSIAKPEDLSTISTLVVQLGRDLAQNGIKKDELDRALNPILEALNQSERQNIYWLESVLNRSSIRPEKLAWAKSRQNDYNSLTLKEINLLFEKFLSPDNAQIIHLLPHSKNKKTN